MQFHQERTEAVLAEPEVQQVIHAFTGQGRTSKAVDLMLGIGCRRIDTALDDPGGIDGAIRGDAGGQRGTGIDAGVSIWAMAMRVMTVPSPTS